MGSTVGRKENKMREEIEDEDQMLDDLGLISDELNGLYETR